MSNGDSKETVPHNPARRRRWSKAEPPEMSDLRIVLLGKSVSENSRMGNFLLGRAAFDSEAPPDVVERVGGRLKDRHVTVINSPQLLQTHLSLRHITHIVRECVYLSDPGPHVIVLLLKHEQCSAEDQECVEKVLDSFSERVFQHTMVLTAQEPTETNDILQKIIQKCFNRHFSLQRSSSPDDLLQTFEDIVHMNDGRHLDCAEDEASQYFTMEQTATERLSEGVKLNLVVCGSDGTLKSSISERILQQTDRRSDMELHGRLVSLVELPALNRLSEEEVMRQTLHCVSLCDPGVHVFLFIIPDAPLTDEDKAEMEEIQKILSSRINKHIMILIIQNSEHQTAELNEETQSVIESFGGRHHLFGPNTQVSTLMKNIEQMLEENRGGFFSTETFLEAQMKKLLQFEEMKKQNNLLQTFLLSQGSIERQDDVRIVLLGKTGVGKSSSGNTILGRDTFTADTSQESVTKESQRETSEINGRLVTVVDTPGLFDTELTNEEIQREIGNCISMILPGPHVFIIVLNLGQRFTQEEATSVKIIQETFGENSLLYTMVLFTRGDYLKNKTIDQCLGKPGSPLMKLIEACGNRFHVFNNNQTEDRTQVSDLLEKIDTMVKANGGSFYSSKMFRQMEREKQEQQMKILMERIKERVELMDKLEEEKEIMKMMFEEERLNHDKERKRREEEFREREERLKREMIEQEVEMRDEMKRQQEMFKDQIKEMSQEKETVKKEKENLQIKYHTEVDRLMNSIENERQIYDNERKRREDEFVEREERYKREMKEKEEHEREIRDEMGRKRETFTHEIEQMRQEKENLQIQYHTELDRLINRIENERRDHEKKRNRREDEYTEREERYKIEMRRERDEWENRREREKQISDEQIQRLKSEMEGIIKDNVRTERERQGQLEDLEKRLKEERNMREDQQKTFEKELKLLEENYEDELKKRQATSAAMFGEVICQKLKEPIEQSVYKKTSRDLADEMRSNCPSLIGNRSKLEKHILKTLAEEEDIEKYMDYINNPRDHFKSFIRDEVSRYITEKFSVSVLPKMKENIRVLEQKIIKAAHESTEHVQLNRGDVGLWLRSFTQQLSDELIFSERDLSGVKHDGDFNLLEDVIRQELPDIISDISRRFNALTFPIHLDYKDIQHEILIDQLCQGCWVQCPFCKAVCTNTIENHHGDHSAHFHRVRGINGTCYSSTQNLCTEMCNSLVASNNHFSTSAERFPCRDYRKAGERFATWSITPDLSELPYWKWFVCRFQKDLEKYYMKTFEGYGKIPDDWRKYSKHEAIQSLDVYI